MADIFTRLDRLCAEVRRQGQPLQVQLSLPDEVEAKQEATVTDRKMTTFPRSILGMPYSVITGGKSYLLANAGGIIERIPL